MDKPNFKTWLHIAFTSLVKYRFAYPPKEGKQTYVTRLLEKRYTHTFF